MNKKIIWAWCAYDFAVSSYSAVIITFVFAAYFTAKVAPDAITGTFLWGRTIAISGLVVAILSPIAGALTDLGGRRKRWLFTLTLAASLATAYLWQAYPYPHAMWETLLAIFLSFTALEIAQVFYNALLAEVAPAEKLGRVSGWGWGAGYVGGLLCLCICLVVFIKGQWSWLSTADYAQVRIIGPFVAIWLFVFALPLFFWVPDKLAKQRLPFHDALVMAVSALWRTLRSLRAYKLVALFLLARMIYTDGLNTLFAFGGIYAEGTFHFELDQVLILGILLNITAGLGAAVFAWADDYLGSKPTILIALAGLIVLGISVLSIHSKTLFWWLAPWLGLFVGPAQSASRSLMTRLAPVEKRTEMFGLYALSGKATAFIGPFLVSSLTLAFASQRVGMSVIFLFFIVGGAILLFLPIK